MEAALLALLLAALTAAAPHYMPASPPPELPAMTETVPEPAAVPETADVPEPGFDERTTVRLLDEGTVTELSLRDYLTGVVLQEMPASFAPEALKAQAVAARTFTLRKIDEGGAHEGADVCGDPGCCQSYLSGPEARAVYGDGYDAAEEKVRAAVADTDGEALYCGGSLIEAAYFSSTAGSTESAAAVWGGDVPYLQPVSSPEPPQDSEKSVSLADFRAALPEAELEGAPAGWFGGETRTSGGSVETMTIGGVSYTGAQLRARFGLRSARFTAAVTEEGISFEVSGYGHGVGMSQYGAETMAEEGRDYREILLHYYTGAELRP